jgi:hypothetical protein
VSVALGPVVGGISRGRLHPLRLRGRRARRGLCLRGGSRAPGACLRELLLRLEEWVKEASLG